MSRRGSQKLTGNPVRALEFLEWRNNSAWMETMRGKRWTALLAKEKRFSNQLLTADVKNLSTHFEKELTIAQRPLGIEGFQIHNGSIVIIGTGSGYQWRWVWSNKYTKMNDIDVYNNCVYYTTDDPQNQYKTIMICEDVMGHEIWRKTGISSQVSVKDGICYYVTVTNLFDTDKIMRCDATTGKDEEVLLESKDPSRFLSVYKDSGNVLFCKSSTWRDSKLWRLDGKRFVRLYEGSVWQMTAGPNCAFVTWKEGEEPVLVGQPLKSWLSFAKDKALSEGKNTIGHPIWINIESGHLILIHEGRQTLYYCCPKEPPKEIYSVIGSINPNPWTKYENNQIQSFMVNTPTDFPRALFVLTNSCEVNKTPRQIPKDMETLFPPLSATKHYGISSGDGTKVPYILVKQHATKRVRGLICYVYSSYGLITPIGWCYSIWGPLLTRGWAIAFCFARGGGDKTEAWTVAGQGIHHIKTVEDFEGVVRASQQLTKVGPDQTVIYGRSAGGMSMGLMTARHPDGDLMGTTYTEVPFVDYLRSTTNMELGLSPSSLAEFGNPAAGPWDFQMGLKQSPIDSVPADGAPGVFVLARTGLKDHQVSPFEPIKWIQKLRGDQSTHADKFIFIEAKEAHSYQGNSFVHARASDLAILYSRLEKKSHSQVYKMARRSNKTRKARKGSKKANRRRATRKH